METFDEGSSIFESTHWGDTLVGSRTKEFVDEQYNMNICPVIEINEDEPKHLDQLPLKSKLLYLSVYKAFRQWCRDKNVNKINESTLVEYFTDKSKVFKSSSLWSHYSMLKATMIIEDNIDIGKYRELMALLKYTKKGYVANKSRIFTKDEIQTFLKQAPDETYLMMKVALIIGISGGCRRDELARLAIDDIDDLGAALLIKIRDEKSIIKRTFTVISEKEDELDCLEIFRKYYRLRPPDSSIRRLFLTYKEGKCLPQVVGKNPFGKIPSMIAKYLQLPEPESYNGHCFRKLSSSQSKNERFF